MHFYIISKYFGRTGNNLLQILSFFHTIEADNVTNYSIPYHKFFSLKNTMELPKSNDSRVLFDKEMLLSLSLYRLKELYHKYLTTTIKPVPQSYDIGIHIRSGDIFQGVGHRLYLQPPMYFYDKILNENPDKSKIIVFENANNPVIPALIEKYKNVQNIFFQSKSLDVDIMTLSQCNILVCSVGTFCLVPFIISSSIEKIVIPDYFTKNIWFTFDNVETEIIDLPGYYTGKWANTKEQREKLLLYQP